MVSSLYGVVNSLVPCPISLDPIMDTILSRVLMHWSINYKAISDIKLDWLGSIGRDTSVFGMLE